jgi:hypothetical protein
MIAKAGSQKRLKKADFEVQIKKKAGIDMQDKKEADVDMQIKNKADFKIQVKKKADFDMQLKTKAGIDRTIRLQYEMMAKAESQKQLKQKADFDMQLKSRVNPVNPSGQGPRSILGLRNAVTTSIWSTFHPNFAAEANSIRNVVSLETGAYVSL